MCERVRSGLAQGFRLPLTEECAMYAAVRYGVTLGFKRRLHLNGLKSHDKTRRSGPDTLPTSYISVPLQYVWSGDILLVFYSVQTDRPAFCGL